MSDLTPAQQLMYAESIRRDGTGGGKPGEYRSVDEAMRAMERFAR